MQASEAEGPMNFYIPAYLGGKILCRYLRIHITDIFNPNDLLTKSTGFVLHEIYGGYASKDMSLQSITLLFIIKN